jgi:ferrous iron transport protein B
LGVLLTGSRETNDTTLIEELHRHIPSPAVALAFLVFVLLYTPCLTTLTTLHREAKKWRWTIFSLLYQTATAYGFAFLTLKIAETLL